MTIDAELVAAVGGSDATKARMFDEILSHACPNTCWDDGWNTYSIELHCHEVVVTARADHDVTDDGNPLVESGDNYLYTSFEVQGWRFR